MTDSSVVDLDTNFVGLGRRNLNLFDAQGLASLPGDGGLALDGLSDDNHIVSFQLCSELSGSGQQWSS